MGHQYFSCIFQSRPRKLNLIFVPRRHGSSSEARLFRTRCRRPPSTSLSVYSYLLLTYSLPPTRIRKILEWMNVRANGTRCWSGWRPAVHKSAPLISRQTVFRKLAVCPRDSILRILATVPRDLSKIYVDRELRRKARSSYDRLRLKCTPISFATFGNRCSSSGAGSWGKNSGINARVSVYKFANITPNRIVLNSQIGIDISVFYATLLG